MTMLSNALLVRANTYDPMDGLGNEINALKNSLKCVMDFSVLGGAVGTIQLKDDQGNPAVLPAGAIVTRSYLDVVTSFTSGGAATVALQLNAAADILAATAMAGLAAGLVEGKQLGTMATAIKVPVGAPQLGQKVQAVIAVAALTAGKMYVWLEYSLSGF